MVGGTDGKIKSEEVLAPHGMYVSWERTQRKESDPKGLPGKVLFEQRLKKGM